MADNCFKPKESKIKKYEILSFDIEGTGEEGGFVHGVCIYKNKVHHFKDKQSMIDFLLESSHRKAYIVATNLQYDLPILFQPFDEKWKILIAGSRVIRASYRKDKGNLFHFFDSLNIAPTFSVWRMGDFLNYKKLPTPPNLLGTSVGTKAWKCKAHDELWCIPCYCGRDALITYIFVKRYQDFLNKLGTNLKSTIANITMELFRSKYLAGSYRTFDKFTTDILREGFYGGRTEVYIKGRVKDFYYYDLNSLYPYVMKKYSYPDPNTAHLISNPKDLSFIENYEGLSKVRVKVPNTHIPLLPVRTEEHLFFPVGEFDGAYSHVELRNAIAENVKILKVYWSFYTETTCSPFKDFVTDLYKERKELEKVDDKRADLVKILMNSLYGKFAQRNHDDVGYLKLVTKDMKFSTVKGLFPYRSGEYVYVIIPFLTNILPCYSNVLWSLYISAYARLELFKYLKAAGSSLIYCDTDSIITFKEFKTSDKLGSLRLIGKYTEGIFLYPKLYFLKDEFGKTQIKAKGIPWKVREDFFFEGKCKFSRPTRIKEALKRDLPISAWIEIEKEVKDVFEKRKITDKADFYTTSSLSYPYDVQEIV